MQRTYEVEDEVFSGKLADLAKKHNEIMSEILRAADAEAVKEAYKIKNEIEEPPEELEKRLEESRRKEEIKRKNYNSRFARKNLK